MNKKYAKIIITFIAILIVLTITQQLKYWNIIPKKSYTADNFGITTIKSNEDYNNSNIDDYTDILNGARKYVETKPKYKSAYYAGEYPPGGVGVCTDVIWSAFKEAGYNLKDLVDEDIKNNLSSYLTITKPDPNIDFRRVRNLYIFFERNATSLTLDSNKIEEWQPGDIVVYDKSHIAIISDKRNKNGKPYIIHHGGQPVLEEDALTRMIIIGHYRWTK
jgi:uncharacterized protein YijF (DUF1287 family)